MVQNTSSSFHTLNPPKHQIVLLNSLPLILYTKINNILRCSINVSFAMGKFPWCCFSQVFQREGYLLPLGSLACYLYFFCGNICVLIFHVSLSFSRAMPHLQLHLPGCQRQKFARFLVVLSILQLFSPVLTLNAVMIEVPHSLIFSWTLLRLSSPSTTGRFAKSLLIFHAEQFSSLGLSRSTMHLC